MSKFHWKDGWYFERLEDGSVHIEKVYSGAEGTNHYEAEAMIGPESWAQIICEVSGKPTDYAAAERFHAGERA